MLSRRFGSMDDDDANKEVAFGNLGLKTTRSCTLLTRQIDSVSHKDGVPI